MIFKLFKYSFIEFFKKVPILWLNLSELSLCIPITLLFFIFNIGEPDEPGFVLHKWIILYSSFISFNCPYDTHAFCSSNWYSGYWTIYIFSLHIFILSLNISLSNSI